MALEDAVTLPAPRPVEGGLLRSARPLGHRWGEGVLFNSSQCIEGLPYPYCPEPDSHPTKEPQTPSEVATFKTVGIHVTVDCTTLGGGDTMKWAEQGLDITREYVLGRELASGVETGNPALEDATPVGSGTSPRLALAVLENEIAETLQGRLAYIHVSPGNAVLLEGVLRYSEGRWYTPSGHIVVISPGYHDLDDIHATGEVYAETSERIRLDSVDRNVNTRFVTAEELGIAVFDPCFNVSVAIEGVSV